MNITTFLVQLLAIASFITLSFSSQIYNYNDDVRGLVAFKEAIFEDPYSRLSDWNVAAFHCSWTAIICSYSAHLQTYVVVGMNLSGSHLRGFLAPEIALLTSLQQLYLNDNMLQGTIPKQISRLKNLAVLDFSNNRFSGPIPPELGNLGNIQKIYLHFNGLTGNLPTELGNLQNLQELRLDRNRLEGVLPGSWSSSFLPNKHAKMRSKSEKRVSLCRLPRLIVGDFSYNFFVGSVPRCLKYLPSSSFRGNCFRDGYTALPRTSQLCSLVQSRNPSEYRKHRNLLHPMWLLILEITTAALVVVCAIIGVSAAVRNCKLKPSVQVSWKRLLKCGNQISVSQDGDLLKDVPMFSRQELEVACEDFSNIIGSSSESIVYKGTLKEGPEITVILLCVLQDYWTSYLEFSFQTKVANLSRLDHENIAKLLGYCRESRPFLRMLVLDYIPNGTLYEHLHCSEGPQLSWLRRMKIVLGVARGLKYLHIDLQPPFVLSELTSNSVYLTEDFSPKIVDYESWKTILPKYKKYGNLEENIFSFGVLLLEIIGGRRSSVDWALRCLGDSDKMGALVDPELWNVRAEEVGVLCNVVSLCVEPDLSKRPSMQVICSLLESGINLSPWADLALSP